jgi:biotin carboxyl carrier protein
MRRRFRVGPAVPAGESGDERFEIDLDEVQPESDEANPGGPGVAVGPIHWAATGASTLEVVVDGWRFELAVEDAARAELRRRATRAPDAAAASGPTEIRAIIPGRIAAVHVVAGDVVEAGQSLLVVEAMKMQNELRTSRAGTVERVAVGEGETIDNGDLLVVLR